MFDAKSSADAAELIGHNGGPDMEAERLHALLGPRRPDPIPAVDSGAPWTAYATPKELKRVATLDAWLFRIKSREGIIRAMRRAIMMRCIRRMRRDLGKD